MEQGCHRAVATFRLRIDGGAGERDSVSRDTLDQMDGRRESSEGCTERPEPDEGAASCRRGVGKC